MTSAAAALLATTAIASAQTSSTPTPGQPGVSVAPGSSSSSNNDPNKPATAQDPRTAPDQRGTTGAASGDRMSPSGETPATKGPQRNDPTTPSNNSKNVQ